MLDDSSFKSAQNGLRGQLRGKVGWRHTFAALRFPNYRLWFYGQLVSLFGTWMQMTAQGFLVFQLSHSAAYLGYVGFAAGVPTWLLSLNAGVVADRVSRRTLLIITQIAMMVLAFILAGLTFFRLVQPWHIVILAFLLGVANAYDAPARQSFVLEMVDREHLTNAIALNATMFNGATAVGPAVAGLVYAATGPAWCFTLNGLSFIAVIAALLRMKLPPNVVPQKPEGSSLANMAEGLRYVATRPAIRTLIGLVALVRIFGLSFATLMPAWAVNILHGNAATNGYLQSARGIGAVGGALLLASLSRFGIKGRLLTFGSVAFPFMLLGFAAVRWLPLSLVLLVGVGGTMILVLNAANALVQEEIPDALRGRVMGIYSMIFQGSMPIGALWVGGAAHRLGEAYPLVIGALVSLAAAGAILAWAPGIRRMK